MELAMVSSFKHDCQHDKKFSRHTIKLKVLSIKCFSSPIITKLKAMAFLPVTKTTYKKGNLLLQE